MEGLMWKCKRRRSNVDAQLYHDIGMEVAMEVSLVGNGNGKVQKVRYTCRCKGSSGEVHLRG